MTFVSINTNIDALNAGRFYSQNVSNLSKSNKMLVSGRVDSDASDAPAAAAVGANLTSAIQSQTQAANNVTQAGALISLAAGSLSTMTQIMQTMKARATQANSDTISASQRAMLDAEYQALLAQVDNTANVEWNDTPLFSGSSSPAPTRFGSLDETKVLNTTDTANTSFSTETADITLDGFVAGSAKDVTVRTGSEGEAIVNITLGNQTFVGTVKYGKSDDIYAAAEEITFTSSGNPSNKITLKTAAADVDLSDTNKIENQLKSILGINQGAPVSLRSGSTSLDSVSGATAGASTRAGVFGISSGYDALTQKVTYSLTDGNTKWTREFDAETLATERSVTFDNGLNITIPAGTDETQQAAGIEMLEVKPGNGINVTFQIGAKSTNTIAFKFLAASAATFGLAGSSISSKDNSIKASIAIDSAINELGSMIAQLGGTQSQLNFTGQGLALQIQNEQAARATFTDADITGALISAQEATALINMSSTVLQNTLQQPKKLAELVQTVLR